MGGQFHWRRSGGAQGLPRVLRARWMPTIRTWMDMAAMVTLGKPAVNRKDPVHCGSMPAFLTKAAYLASSVRKPL
jgi:hypothetical protein